MPRPGHNSGYPTMPFGKHRGKAVDEVPQDYLEWCLATVDRLQPYLREAIEHHLGVEPGWPRSRAEPDADPCDPCEEPRRSRGAALAGHAAVVRAWYREMMLRFHPDRGGSNEAAAALTFAKDRLLEMLEDAQG